jgi:ketosteroid isomerase-like protein
MTDEVEAANTALYEALESADVDRMASVWDDVAPDDVVCVHPGWPMLRGRAHVLRSFSAIMANTPYIQFFLTDVEVSVLGSASSGGSVIASVTCTENVLTGDERTGPDAFGGAKAVATNVFVRMADGWRLWIHHASPVMSGEQHDDA